MLAPITEETQKTVGRNAPEKSHRVEGIFRFLKVPFFARDFPYNPFSNIIE